MPLSLVDLFVLDQPNETTEEWNGKSSKELQCAIDNTQLLEKYKVSSEMSNANAVSVLAGEGAGGV